ncbi:MAG: tyrosine-type recombinase/integrase [Pseudomonadota bacterium]|nr:tyrosine-type recombinase/integrase [Pseudomonadota bacterium]
MGLAHFRVHDLRHTFATRLRAAGVAKEDRSALLGHVTTSMPEHYAAADVERLVELANRTIKRHEIQTVLKVAYG